MKEVIFTKTTKIESNTYYHAAQERYDYYLSDTTRSCNAEYRSHTTRAGEYLDIAFLLKDLENVTLDFGGATLVFHGRIQPFMIDNCTNVTLKNVKIDYDRPFYTQATVYECTETNMKLRIDDGFPYRVEDDHSFVAVSETWEKKMNTGDCLLWMYDPEDREDHSIILALFGDTIHVDGHSPMPIKQLLAKQEDDFVTVHGEFPQDWVGRTGQKLVITHEVRDKNTMQTVGGENIAFDHVQILCGASLALVCMHTKNITANHFELIGNYNGNGRIVTNNADGIHTFNCYGKIEIKNCTMEGLLDDTVNIHGNFLSVTELLEDGVWCNTKLAGLTPALKVILPEDRAGIFRGSTREKIAEVTVTAVEEDNVRGGRILRFRETDVLPLLHEGDTIENLSANPEVLIENCVFKRFRGIMRLQSGGKSVIRNCRYENRGTSLMLTGDTTYWYESGPVLDLTVENCFFAHADLGYRIANDTQVAYTEKAPYYHRGVTVRNCFFDGALACRFDHMDDITFTGNTTSAETLYVSLDNCGTRRIEGAEVR